MKIFSDVPQNVEEKDIFRAVWLDIINSCVIMILFSAYVIDYSY